MNLLKLSIKSIVSRPLSSLLSWLLLAFGVTVIVLILQVSDQLRQQISKNAKGIDLVVGAKGSPLQLILSCIFHVDFPTGNISLQDADQLSKNRLIEQAIPLSLGDSYLGYRIVGTTEAYGQLYEAKLQSGAWFNDHMQAVIGADVARELGWSLGQNFESQHGLDVEGESHDGEPFSVVGILEKNQSVLDRLILVNMESVWHVHAHEEEAEVVDSAVWLTKLGFEVSKSDLSEKDITAMLIRYKSPMAAVMLPRAVNEVADFQAASPAYETARLFNIIGVGVQVLNGLGMLIVLLSAISVWIALLNSLKDRKYDMAIMRSMGATRLQIFLHVLIEGVLIAAAGGLAGLLFAHGILFGLTFFFTDLNLQPLNLVAEEGWVLVGSLAIGLLASIIPAVLAYRTDISKTLAKG